MSHDVHAAPFHIHFPTASTEAYLWYTITCFDALRHLQVVNTIVQKTLFYWYFTSSPVHMPPSELSERHALKLERGGNLLCSCNTSHFSSLLSLTYIWYWLVYLTKRYYTHRTGVLCARVCVLGIKTTLIKKSNINKSVMIALVFISQVDVQTRTSLHFFFWILRLSINLTSFRHKTHTHTRLLTYLLHGAESFVRS